MTKKYLMALILSGFIAGSVFALPEFRLSAGGGLYFSNDFSGGAKYVYQGRKLNRITPYAGGGLSGFFDATYAELSLGYFLGIQTIKEARGMADEKIWSALDIGAMGKLPLIINEQCALFPLAGIQYRLAINARDESALWFKFGGGLDYSITEKIYIRGEALYGIRLENQSEKEWGDVYDEGNVTVYPGHGLTINAALGYRF